MSDIKNPFQAIRVKRPATMRDVNRAKHEAFMIRLGKNPYSEKREMTEEKKEAAKIRLSEARKNRAL